MPKQELKKCLTALPEVGEVRCRFEFVFIGPHAKELAEKAASCEAQPAPTQGRNSCDWASVLSGESVGAAWSENTAESAEKKKQKQQNNEANPLITIYCVVDDEEHPPICARVKVRIAENFSDHLPQLQSEESLLTTCFVFLWDTRLDIAGDVAPNLESRRVELEFLYAQVQKKSQVRAKPYVAVLRHAGDPDDREAPSKPEPAFGATGTDQSTATPSSKSRTASKEKQTVALDPFGNLLAKLASMRKVWDGIEKEVDFENDFDFFDAFQELAAQMYTSSNVFYSSTARSTARMGALGENASRCCVVL